MLTSNRDEQPQRETILPKIYKEDEVKLLFPKDQIAGGTWIGVSSKKRLVCVLNGAFKKHIRKDKYAKSRGVIAKEILKATNLENHIKHLNLDAVEPFTMVIVDWNKNKLGLYELVWDETNKHFNKLKLAPQIWSSSTLYNDAIKATRKEWFKNWEDTNEFTLESILSFHHSEIGSKEQSILMKRPQVETVSITSVKKQYETVEMQYEDIIAKKKMSINL
jgi:hypothetical protein